MKIKYYILANDVIHVGQADVYPITSLVWNLSRGQLFIK